MPFHNGMRRICAPMVLVLACRFAFALGEGTLVERQIQSDSLKQNKVGTDIKRRLAIYLPSGYETSHQRYTVIYVLQNGSYRGDFDQHHASAFFDQAIAKNIIPPCIVVAADFSTPLGPSWYVNSPVTGNWDDFAVKELVPYVDANFRTLAGRSSRAIIGSYLGGYGALRLGILHPDVFGVVYAMHPVGTGSGVQVMTARPDWGLLMGATSIDQVKNAGFSTLFLSMFQAFLPNETNAPLYADLPMKNSAGSYSVDAKRMDMLRSRFFIAELVPQHLERSILGKAIQNAERSFAVSCGTPAN